MNRSTETLLEMTLPTGQIVLIEQDLENGEVVGILANFRDVNDEFTTDHIVIWERPKSD